MRAALLFTALAACAGKGPSGPPPPAAAVDARPPADAAPAASARGGRCGECADGLACLALPGGYCASACGAGCDGACVETGTLGDVCLARCTRDADCREREGYTCDPAWHACSLPNLAAIVPRQCPMTGPAIDASFAPSEPIGLGRAPVAAITDGGPVALFEAGDSIAYWPPTAIIGEGRTSPALAATRGALHALWRTRAGVELAVSKDRGATWSEPSAFAGTDECGDCSAPPLLASNGEIVYALYGGPDVGLRARRSRDGGATFEPPVAVALGTIGSAVVDRTGALHLATLIGGVHGGYGSAMQSIAYSAALGPPSIVSGRDEQLPTFFATPSLAVDSARKRAWVAYVRGGRDAAWDVVIAATRDAGKTWVRTRIGDGCAIHLLPALALDPTTGTVHVTFYDTNASPGRYVHATCVLGGAGPPACAVLGAIDAQPFTALDVGRLGPSYLGERTSLVVDDAHRMLHAFWAQPFADGIHVVHAQAVLGRR